MVQSERQPGVWSRLWRWFCGAAEAMEIDELTVLSMRVVSLERQVAALQARANEGAAGQ